MKGRQLLTALFELMNANTRATGEFPERLKRPFPPARSAPAGAATSTATSFRALRTVTHRMAALHLHTTLKNRSTMSLSGVESWPNRRAQVVDVRDTDRRRTRPNRIEPHRKMSEKHTAMYSTLRCIDLRMHRTFYDE